MLQQMRLYLVTVGLMAAFFPLAIAKNSKIPVPPKPEPISVKELPLPPVSSSTIGACNSIINPNYTGCIDQIYTITSAGSFLPDNNHVIVIANFTGAPAPPAPGSIYSGIHLIIVRTNGTYFPSGSPWKCITCGVPASQSAGLTSSDFYAQAFHDGRRILIGNNIVDGGAHLTSELCTPNTTHMYPIRWNTAVDGSGPGGATRELRLHPDQVHLGFNAFTPYGESSFLSTLVFNPSPTVGLPMSPRYDLANITGFYSSSNPPYYVTINSTLFLNTSAITVGEFRGFSGDGEEIFYVGSDFESDNIDMSACNLNTGVVRRITQLPGYIDPIDSSKDNKWLAILDGRFTNRTDFMDGMRGIPAVNDIVLEGVATAVRSNGDRRFLEPWLLDHYGDRGDYHGQKINAEGDGSPGSINDPQWNARADPRWSFDGTKITYHQALTLAPDCGGINPLPCPVSTAQGGRAWRVMVAELTSRKPVPLPIIKPISDYIPWGTPYIPGTIPTAGAGPALAPGNYTLYGKSSGHAKVQLIGSATTGILTVDAVYSSYSDDGLNFINGAEHVTVKSAGYDAVTNWYSNLTGTGAANSTKVTSADGFNLTINLATNEFDANGTLTTTVNGAVYRQPCNFC